MICKPMVILPNDNLVLYRWIIITVVKIQIAQCTDLVGRDIFGKLKAGFLMVGCTKEDNKLAFQHHLFSFSDI